MTEPATIDAAAAAAEIDEQRSDRAAVWVLITLGTIVLVPGTPRDGSRCLDVGRTGLPPAPRWSRPDRCRVAEGADG